MTFPLTYASIRHKSPTKNLCHKKILIFYRIVLTKSDFKEEKVNVEKMGKTATAAAPGTRPRLKRNNATENLLANKAGV